MKEPLQTYKTVNAIDCIADDYFYQDLLTPKLDDLEGDFDQKTINEIVLWKVNRYARLKHETLDLLNKINKEDRIMDGDLTRQILEELLGKDHKGIRLAMASTILRFKNPNIYQIIDQRVYRFINGEELKYPHTNVEKQINTYFKYLEKLNQVCMEKKIAFRDADRIFYMMDKKYNTKLKLN